LNLFFLLLVLILLVLILRVKAEVNLGHWFDEVSLDSDLPTLVLYATFASKEFNDFHAVLKNLAEEKKIDYLYRHVVDKGPDSKPVFLSGYGVELQIKSTEYKAVDGYFSLLFFIEKNIFMFPLILFMQTNLDQNRSRLSLH
jgi:hypothetical protein